MKCLLAFFSHNYKIYKTTLSIFENELDLRTYHTISKEQTITHDKRGEKSREERNAKLCLCFIVRSFFCVKRTYKRAYFLNKLLTFFAFLYNYTLCLNCIIFKKKFVRMFCEIFKP